MNKSSQFLNLSEILSMSTLAESFKKYKSEQDSDDKVKKRLFQQLRECNSKINDPIWPDFKLVWDFIHVHLTCKFQGDLIKTE